MSYSNIQNLTNWTLKRGSHEFPGEGTCINEAAMIAAGFEYNPVKSWRDCPPCFCPVLSAFAIKINDCVSDEMRQQLLPAIIRLSGSKDPENQQKRCEFIVRQAVLRIVVPLFRKNGLDAHADAMESAPGMTELRGACLTASVAAGTAWTAARDAARDAARAAAWVAERDAVWAVAGASWIARTARSAAAYQHLIDIFFDAMDIGKQADAHDSSVIQARVDVHLEMQDA